MDHETRVELIDPERAKAFLEKNTKNRSVRPGRVRQFADDMSAGRWLHAASSIKFDWDGNLIDGQHTLLAVIASGYVGKFTVERGHDPAVMKVLDTGAARTARDVFHLAFAEEVSRDQIATLRAYLRGPGASAMNASASALYELFERHREPVSFVNDIFRELKVSKRLNKQMVRGAIARAWHHIDHARLRRFSETYVTGAFPENESDRFSSVLALRRYIEQQDGSNGGVSRKSMEMYLKAARAIELFAAATPTGKLYAAAADPFPLPVAKEAR